MKKVTFCIEDMNGNDIMHFQIEVDGDEVKVVNQNFCSVADVDDDYIFNSGTDMIRIQEDER